jgi:hypothetical protein
VESHFPLFLIVVDHYVVQRIYRRCLDSPFVAATAAVQLLMRVFRRHQLKEVEGFTLWREDQSS